MLPQFFDPRVSYIGQVSVMTAVYSIFVFAVMPGCRWLATRAEVFFCSAHAARLLRRAGTTLSPASALLIIAGMLRPD